MEKATIHIIANLKYHKYFPSTPTAEKYKTNDEFQKDLKYYKESQFYRCNGKDNILSYLTRKTAVDNISEENRKLIETLETVADSNAHKNIFDYADKRPGSTGAFDLDGDIDKEKMHQLKENLKSTKSNIWSGVLSFTQEYGSLHCSNKKQAKDIIRKSIKSLFIEQGLNPDNIELFAAFHNNTDHPHIHFFYWEKEPIKLDKNGNAKFSNFKIPVKAVDTFKSKVAYICEGQSKKLDFSLRDQIRESFKRNNVSDNRLQLFLKLDKELGNEHSNQYARLNKDQKIILNHFIDDYVESNPILSLKWNAYIGKLTKMQKDIAKLHQENKINLSKAAASFSKNRIDELYNRCGNEILKSTKNICDSQVEIKKQLKELKTNKAKYLKYETANNKILIQNNSNSKKYLRSLLVHLISDTDKQLGKDVNKALDEFYQELEERGEKGIYENEQ